MGVVAVDQPRLVVGPDPCADARGSARPAVWLGGVEGQLGLGVDVCGSPGASEEGGEFVSDRETEDVPEGDEVVADGPGDVLGSWG